MILSYLGTFVHFSALQSYFLGLSPVKKIFLRPTNVDYQFWFWKYSPIFNSKFDPILGLFGPFGANFGVGVRSKKFCGTFLHRLTTFILDV